MLVDCGKERLPPDAMDEIKAVSDFVSSKKGGDGAVREFIKCLYGRKY